VAEYDRRRFGSPSGEWVNNREIAAVLALLPPGGQILDLGCGTGRLSRQLVARNYKVILLDSSDAMLARAVPAVGAPAILADAFALPFAPSAFDAVVALRLAFHFTDLAGLLASVSHALRPGGRFVFDTYRWSPRALVALAAQQWGGKVHAHSASAVQRAADKAELRLATSTPCFLFSPYVYRLLPLTVVQILARVEELVPESGRARVFWSFEKE